MTEATDSITITTREGGERELVRDRVYFVKTIWEDREKFPHGVPSRVEAEGETVLWVSDPDAAGAMQSFVKKEHVLDVTPARRVYVPAEEES